MLPQQFHQVPQNPALHSFHIDAVDQEFVAIGSQLFQILRVHLVVREGLPSVRHDVVRVVVLVFSWFPSATQIQHQTFLAANFHQFFQSFHVNLALRKHVRRDNHVRRTGIEPRQGVGVVDPPANLESLGVGLERVRGGLLISRTQHDHVATGQGIGLVHFSVIRCRPIGLEVRVQGGLAAVVVGGSIRQGRANDLLDLAVV
mmetsp:Transcript_25670/g.56304  ORF Transcript_25670/g.56304 Transcript_25670/m.56304 type:complete len:202 (+) Transcript_25670:358-963(+)